MAAQQKIKTAINAITQRTGAETSWETSLSTNEQVIVRPLYSVDLERAWLHEKAILFVGELVNVTTKDETNYTLLVRHAYVRSPELRLELICPKQPVDIVLQSIRSSQAGFLPGGIAVAAKVSRVEHHVEPEKEGSNSVFTGYGQCIDVVHLGDTMDLCAYSGASWPPVPIEVGHSFRCEVGRLFRHDVGHFLGYPGMGGQDPGIFSGI
jgi:hypothetical protein